MLNTEGLCLKCMNDNGGERICPICGFDNSSKNPDDCLPLKSVVQSRYICGAVLERDDEGITYAGWDSAKMSKIKIHEYFPEGFALRRPDKTVSITEEGKYTFNEGLIEFIEINRSVMISTLPSLIKVFDVFEENGTAYAITEFISGITLEEFLIKNGSTLKWEQARPLFLPLIDTIGGMNELGYIHGGISTETIIVGRDGKLRIGNYSIRKLRRTDSELNYKIYSGFAACEQYGSNEYHMDTYTDVYGLCATLFRVLIGEVPPEASQRIHNDVMTIPSRFAQELPRQVLAGLANGLQVLPQNRTKDIETFKNELVYGEIETVPAPERHTAKPAESAPAARKKSNSAKYVLVSALCTVLAFGIIAIILVTTVFKDSVFGGDSVASGDNIPSIDAPAVDSIGEMDSGAEITAKYYTVPDLRSKYYSEIIKEEDYEMFEFVIKGVEFSDDCPKGTICQQSLKSGTEAVRDTKIEVVISMGPKEISIANLMGFTEDEAVLELLKQGFIYENIKILEKYDEDSEPGTVIDQNPKYGDKVNTSVAVEIYINSYTGDTSSSGESSVGYENIFDQ